MPESYNARALAAGASAANAPHDTTIATPNPPAGISAEVAKERGIVLDALSTDFQHAMEEARKDPQQSGPGWVTVYAPVRGAAETRSSADGASVDANGKSVAPLDSSRDKPGQSSSGRNVRVFSESAFRDAYLKAGGTALQAAAKHYGASDVSQLLELHPELRWIALDIVTPGTSDPLRPGFNGEAPWRVEWVPPYGAQALMSADPVTRVNMERINAQSRQFWEAEQGAAVPGSVPSASAEELRAIDVSLSTEGNRVLLAIFATNAPGASEIDPVKIAAYGLQRAQAMAQLERATHAANLQTPTPAFRGEAMVRNEWLTRRAELVQQVQAEFIAFEPAMNGHPEWINMATRFDGFVKSSAALNALAQYLGYADTAAMISIGGHPDLANLANPAWRGGPAPAGAAMASPEAIGSVDLALNDPDNQALIKQFGGPPPTPNGGLASEQVRLYGLTRYQAMTQLSAAMAAVRQDYLIQLNDAKARAHNPAFLIDGKFSVEAFTAWYAAQPGAANQAFTRQMGPMTTREVPDLSSEEAGRNTLIQDFAQSPWQLTTSQARPGEQPYFLFQVRDPEAKWFQSPSILSIDPQAPPALNDFQYVGFDARLGWITPRQNLHQDGSGIGEVLHDVVVIGISSAVGGVVGGQVAAWLGGSTGVVAGAAAGAATSAAFSGAMNNSFSWREVLKAGLIGAASAGLSRGLASLGPELQQFSVLVTSPAFNQALTQGTIAAIQGESFGKAALMGFVSGLSQDVGKILNAGIDNSTNMTAVEKAAAHTAVRALTSAIQIAGDPEHPSQVFAAAFVKDFVNSVVQGIDFEKEVWGRGTPEQLSEQRLAERTKVFMEMTDAEGKAIFSTPDQQLALRRMLLQDPTLTPESYRTAQDYLRLSAIVYRDLTGPASEVSVPKGYTQVTVADDSRLEGVSFADQSGFYAELYRNDATGKFVVSIRGTDDLSDIPTGYTQAFDPNAEQYKVACALARKLQDRFGDQLEGFTGHSMGGGLAAAAAAVTGTTAITFNAQGVSEATINANLRPGGDPVVASTLAGQVVNFHVQGEILTGLQVNAAIGTIPLAVLAAGIHGYLPYALTAAGIAAPNALGTQITLMPLETDGTESGFFTRILDAVYLHKMGSLLPSMQTH